jgi:hypothetical protein
MNMKMAQRNVVLALMIVLAAASSVAQQTTHRSLTGLQKRLLSGSVARLLEPPSTANLAVTPLSSLSTVSATVLCAGNFSSNIRVNRNCLTMSDTDFNGQGQANAEATIAQDPNNLGHLVAGDVDFRRGDDGCGAAFSLTKGSDWRDSTIPIGFTRGTNFGAARQYWEISLDPSAAWDTKGDAYVACLALQRGAPISNNPDISSAVYVFRSTGSNGASWNFPGRAVQEINAVSGSFNDVLDKPYITVDTHSGSLFQDRVYVTWTDFAADGTAYIYASFSNDYGQSFSAPVAISGNSALCNQTFGLPTTHGSCNESQYSQPFTGPDGALYVVFANFNNFVITPDNRNQILLVKSVDGGNTFSAPVKVSDYYDLPDCATYQAKDFGRSCVPEKGNTALSFFRASNYPVGAVNPGNASQVVVTVGSYINIDSNEFNGCAPMSFSGSGLGLYAGVKVSGGCNNKIMLSVSADGGSTFTGAASDPRQLPVVNQATAQANTDQWFQWTSFTTTGKVAVSYYDRQYGSDETTGFMDVSLSDSSNLTSFATTRVTTNSMPPPTQFSGLFMGDYSGLAAIDDNAHPIWTDTRNRDVFLCPGTGVPGVPPKACSFSASVAGNDQEIYTRTLLLP